MIEGRVIVCLASAWDYDPTSKHQIMRILSKRNDVVWVNYHGTRKPSATAADVRACFSALRRVARGTNPISSSMVQVTPLVIPGVTNRFLRFLHQRMLVAQIRRAVRSVIGTSNKPLQVWTFAPDVPYLIGRLGEECFIYYCVDDYTKFEGFNRRAIASAEGELVDRADLVVTTSQPLLGTKSVRRPDAVLVRHGVDFDHFASAWRTTHDRPKDLQNIPSPVFGFFGLIQHWIDLELIAEVARLRPQYAFVLIGDCRVDAGIVKTLRNVFLLGRRRYEDLPAYCSAFTAGLLPFACNAMTQSINPIKMTEYLAAGLPVVSTALPEARRYEGPITIGRTPEEFAHACDAVIASDHPDRRARISALVKDQSWDATVEHLSDLVMSRLESRKSSQQRGDRTPGEADRAPTTPERAVRLAGV